jgi:hypothetical protein
MRKCLVVSSIVAVAAILAVSSVAVAQSGAAKSDLSGVFARTGALRTLSDPPPPMTPAAKAKYEGNKPSYNLPSNPRAIPPALGNDPAGRCDPLGLVRSLYAIGRQYIEFVETPNRIFQFFEWNHVWRTIWMDGRKLPADPDPKWYGYSVGHWEGDTLVVESNGFDDRTWLDQYGDPFSGSMKLEERWRRVGDTLEMVLKVDDPETYTKTWNGNKVIWRLQPKGEIHEEVCAPIDENFFNENTRNRAGGVSK